MINDNISPQDYCSRHMLENIGEHMVNDYAAEFSSKGDVDNKDTNDDVYNYCFNTFPRENYFIDAEL